MSGSPRSKLSPPVPLGSVENEGVKIVTGKTWREEQDQRNQVMIQNLEKNPTTICVDSGAGESVCPVDFFPDYETHQTEKVGDLYRAAGGQELRNMGEKRPKFQDERDCSIDDFPGYVPCQKAPGGSIKDYGKRE